MTRPLIALTLLYAAVAIGSAAEAWIQSENVEAR